MKKVAESLGAVNTHRYNLNNIIVNKQFGIYPKCLFVFQADIVRLE